METAPGHRNDPSPALSTQAGTSHTAWTKPGISWETATPKTTAEITVQQMLLLGAAVQNLWWLQAKFSLFNRILAGLLQLKLQFGNCKTTKSSRRFLLPTASHRIILARIILFCFSKHKLFFSKQKFCLLPKKRLWNETKHILELPFQQLSAAFTGGVGLSSDHWWANLLKFPSKINFPFYTTALISLILTLNEDSQP